MQRFEIKSGLKLKFVLKSINRIPNLIHKYIYIYKLKEREKLMFAIEDIKVMQVNPIKPRLFGAVQA